MTPLSDFTRGALFGWSIRFNDGFDISRIFVWEVEEGGGGGGGNWFGENAIQIRASNRCSYYLQKFEVKAPC